jgi:hypothetical protein
MRFGKPRVDNCLHKPWRGRNLWGWRLRYCDRLLPARSQGASRPGGISSGEISPRQFVMSRISRRQLSESQHLYLESGMVNCFLPHSPNPPIPHSQSPSSQATHKRKSRVSDPALVLWRPAISLTPRQSQLHARACWSRNGWKRSGPRSGLGQRNDNHPGDL